MKNSPTSSTGGEVGSGLAQINYGKLLEEAAKTAEAIREDSDLISREEEDRLELERQAALLNDLQNTIEARKEYAKKLFWLVALWLLFTALFLIAAACPIIQVENSVIIALITSATANVIGVFTIVVKYFFPPT